GYGGHTVLHDVLHGHRSGRLAISRKCMNDFTLGNETKNLVLSHHHEGANILCAEPVCRPLDAGFRSNCRDVGAFPSQDSFDGHSLLPPCGVAACLISPAEARNPCSSTGDTNVSHRHEAVSGHLEVTAGLLPPKAGPTRTS